MATNLLTAEDLPSWSYDGAVNGPSTWGRLHPSYELCKEGDQQSPLSITAPTLTKDDLSPVINYRLDAFRFRDSGLHSYFIPQSKQSLQFQFQSYDFGFIRVHTPAEHQVLSQRFPVSFQLHHRAESGEKLVVVILFVHGAEDTIDMEPFLTLLNEKDNPKKKDSFNMNQLFLDHHRFYHYRGSMTVPPCDEETHWLIVNQPVVISQDSFLAFKKMRQFNANNRPLQVQGKRVISLL